MSVLDPGKRVDGLIILAGSKIIGLITERWIIDQITAAESQFGIIEILCEPLKTESRDAIFIEMAGQTWIALPVKRHLEVAEER